MSLPQALAKLTLDFDAVSKHLKDFSAGKPSLKSSNNFAFVDECLLEGLLSRTWQSWCEFCRSCLIHSCMGSVSISNVPIIGLPQATSESVVSGAAVKAKKQNSQPPYWGSAPNSILRYEPTWGDGNVISQLIQRLSPNNQGQLLAAFSSGYASARAIQTVRNCAAHTNHETFGEVNALSSSYLAFAITHPTQAMFWVDHSTSDYLIFYAMKEMLAAATAAVS